jgi:hypothetical protein
VDAAAVRPVSVSYTHAVRTFALLATALPVRVTVEPFGAVAVRTEPAKVAVAS